jgi:hypothetical protein
MSTKETGAGDERERGTREREAEERETEQKREKNDLGTVSAHQLSCLRAS